MAWRGNHPLFFIIIRGVWNLFWNRIIDFVLHKFPYSTLSFFLLYFFFAFIIFRSVTVLDIKNVRFGKIFQKYLYFAISKSTYIPNHFFEYLFHELFHGGVLGKNLSNFQNGLTRERKIYHAIVYRSNRNVIFFPVYAYRDLHQPSWPSYCANKWMQFMPWSQNLIIRCLLKSGKPIPMPSSDRLIIVYLHPSPTNHIPFY